MPASHDAMISGAGVAGLSAETGNYPSEINISPLNEIMRNISHFIHGIWERLLVGMGALFVLLPFSPLNMPTTGRDSGVFLYIGWRILNGEMPYKDLWDHKPPGIFYINALGITISNNAWWGVWLLELISLFTAASLSFLLIKKVLGVLPAVFGLYIGLISLVCILQGGNFTTEYTLPIQFLCLWLAVSTEHPSYRSRRGYILGVLSGTAFLLKQNTIGVCIAIAIHLLLDRIKSRQIRKFFVELIVIASGTATVIVATIIFFAAHGSLQQFWEEAFAFNIIYSTSALPAQYNVLVSGISAFWLTGLLEIALLGFGLGLVHSLFPSKFVTQQHALFSIGVIGLPIDFFLADISQRSYPHYYIILLPFLSIFAALAFKEIAGRLLVTPPKKLAFLCCMLIMIGMHAYLYFQIVKIYRGTHENYHAVISYIQEQTSPNDFVLVWGADTEINFLAKRRSPSRFSYQFPLYLDGYTNQQLISEFLDDIIRNKPKLIIDTKESYTPILDFPVRSIQLQEKISFIKSHYCQQETIENLPVYKYTGSSCP